MNAEIIAVGTELLLGQIANTNAQFLSEELNALGFSVYFHSVVGDNAGRLERQLEIAAGRSQLIVLTGGLGPTADDITKEVVAKIVGRRLVTDQEALAVIERFYRERQIKMTENNKRQALVLEGSHIFPNETGLAPGMAVEHEGVHYLLFPGPPKELKPMFLKHARPYLLKLSPEQGIVFSKVMRFCGIGESALESRLEDLIEQQSNPTIAPLAKEGEVTLRLTCHGPSKEKAEQMIAGLVNEILKRVGQYHYGWDEQSLEEVLVQRLKEKGWSVATAESCTGGLISHLISRVSGASQVFMGGVVSYTNESKRKHLHIPEEILTRHGAVSEETAKLMAAHVRRSFGADLGLSITGVAGPTQQEEKPIGLIYMGIASQQGEKVIPLKLMGERQVIQERAAKLALFYLIKALEQEK